jgi:hypothetical protein
VLESEKKVFVGEFGKAWHHDHRKSKQQSGYERGQ